jgi:hypothetical protein
VEEDDQQHADLEEEDQRPTLGCLGQHHEKWKERFF